MSRRRKPRETFEQRQLREARAVCAYEFEPLWKPAPFAPLQRGLSPLERADIQAAAKRAAFAWLSAKLGIARIDNFDAIADIETLRVAYRLIWRSQLNDVRRWADAVEAEAA